MSHEVSIRRAAAAVGTAGLLALSLTGPASARPDPGGGTPQQQTQESSRCHYLGECAGTGSTDPSPTARIIAIDDNALELLQVGAGLMTGLALGGAGVVLVRRRSQAHPSPA